MRCDFAKGLHFRERRKLCRSHLCEAYVQRQQSVKLHRALICISIRVCAEKRNVLLSPVPSPEVDITGRLYVSIFTTFVTDRAAQFIVVYITTQMQKKNQVSSEIVRDCQHLSCVPVHSNEKKRSSLEAHMTPQSVSKRCNRESRAHTSVCQKECCLNFPT